MRSLCRALGEACWGERVELELDGRVLLSVGPGEVDGRQGWVVVDHREGAEEVEHLSSSAHAAARHAYALLGDQARRVVGLVVGRWRYAQLFPLGSSLAWVPMPLTDLAV